MPLDNKKVVFYLTLPDLLARAGYALSPADMTDIIFSFYIEHNHFDVIDIDIQLEEHGLPCIIS